jgi:hypothetical protein
MPVSDTKPSTEIENPVTTGEDNEANQIPASPEPFIKSFGALPSG